MKKIGFVVFSTIVIATVLFAQTTGSRTSSSGKIKYEYALLRHADKWDRIGNPEEWWVNSLSVSEETKKRITSLKNTQAALNLLGAEGWELVSVINERMDYGTMYVHYLRRAVN